MDGGQSRRGDQESVGQQAGSEVASAEPRKERDGSVTDPSLVRRLGCAFYAGHLKSRLRACRKASSVVVL